MSSIMSRQFYEIICMEPLIPFISDYNFFKCVYKRKRTICENKNEYNLDNIGYHKINKTKMEILPNYI